MYRDERGETISDRILREASENSKTYRDFPSSPNREGPEYGSEGGGKNSPAGLIILSTIALLIGVVMTDFTMGKSIPFPNRLGIIGLVIGALFLLGGFRFRSNNHGIAVHYIIIISIAILIIASLMLLAPWL